MECVSACEKLISYKTDKKNEIFNICAGQKINIKILFQIVKLFLKHIKMIKLTIDVYQTFGLKKR